MNTHLTATVEGEENLLGHAESNKLYGIKNSPNAHHGKVYSQATLADTNSAFAKAWAQQGKKK